tara:strand:- start:9078 stop:10790 length:1713 start_codon:yes stop_codon:yes gene_type:complete
MGLDILGVIKSNFFTLSNYTLTKQLMLINLVIAFVGLVIIVFINIYLIKSDKRIEKKIIETINKLESTTFFLENNSIARVPLFKNCRIDNLINESCRVENQDKQILLSELELEPTSAQQYIIQNYQDNEVNIRIYNDNMIEIINSSTLFIGDKSVSKIKVLEINEKVQNSEKSINTYLNQYVNLFNFIYSKLTKDKFISDIVKKKHDIQIFRETIKKRRLINYKYLDKEDNVIHLSSAPIITNNKVFGIVIATFQISKKNNDLGYTSFILFNFYILFILVTIFLSLFFVRDLIIPLKQLSRITLLERKKNITDTVLEYPIRKDEIGILSNEMKNMSNDLKLQISKLEKFTTDVAHELKNPLTGIKSSSELLLKQNISEENKRKVLKNFNKEVDRMNRLISDISNFSKTISEIETEKFEYFYLDLYLEKFKKNYLGNNKNIILILQQDDFNLRVLINKDKFLQVLINLVENSVSMSESDKKILIKSKKIDDYFLEIKIYDQGRGINYKDKNKIFNRFYTDRDENSTHHSGLGLSISKEIISSFNGSLELTESDNLDFRGACFLIKLPLSTS